MAVAKNQIRVLALALIRDRDRLFLSQGHDPATGGNFYRALGGGIDFGETSREALKREFREEIGAELTNIRYLDCLESIFTFDNQLAHEIVQLYQADFADPRFYQVESVKFKEGNREKTALWIDLDACFSGELRIVPEGFLKYCQSQLS